MRSTTTRASFLRRPPDLSGHRGSCNGRNSGSLNKMLASCSLDAPASSHATAIWEALGGNRSSSSSRPIVSLDPSDSLTSTTLVQRACLAFWQPSCTCPTLPQSMFPGDTPVRTQKPSACSGLQVALRKVTLLIDRHAAQQPMHRIVLSCPCVRSAYYHIEAN